jgi:hypothetical protein
MHGMWAMGLASGYTLSDTHRNTAISRPKPDSLSRPSHSYVYPDASVPNPRLRGHH